MLPKCFFCKKSKVGPSVAEVRCPVHPEKNLYSAPFNCDDFEKTDNGDINYPKENSGA